MQLSDLAGQNYSAGLLNSAPASTPIDLAKFATPLSTAIAPKAGRSSLLFVDAGVRDYQSLLAGVQPGTEVHVLDATQDAIGQITQTLLGRQGITSLHILSHGEAGGLQFGQNWLSLANLTTYAPQLQTWNNALTADADILLYGCNVGSGEMGQAFMQILSQLTGADVAASDNLTGNATLGGDWILEKQTGAITAPLALSTAAETAYASVLKAQVRPVTDFSFNPSVPSTAANLTSVNDTLYFTANNGPNGSQLWRVDLLAPYSTPQTVYQPGTNPANLTNLNGTLYFTATEGTATRLYRLAPDPNPGYPGMVETIPMSGSNPSNLMGVNDSLFFTVNDGNGTNLWKIAPASALYPGGALPPAVPQPIQIGGNIAPNPTNFTTLNGTLYFLANNGPIEMLWKLEPGKTTAVMISGTTPSSDLNNLMNVNGKLYLTATEGGQTKLWQVDRPSDPNLPELLTPIASPPFTNIQSLTNVNGIIYFTATNATEGTELYSVNPQQGNYAMPAFMRSGPAGSDPANLTNVNGKLYFIATDDATGRELRCLNVGPNGNGSFTDTIELIYGNASSNPANLVNLNGTLYFTAQDSPTGPARLWQIQPGPNGATGFRNQVYMPNGGNNLANLTVINGSLFFTADSWNGQTELWQIKAKDTNSYNPPIPTSLGWFNSVAGAPLANWLTIDGKVFFTANTTSQSSDIFVVESQAPNVNISNTYLPYTENSAPILIADYPNVYDPDTTNLQGAMLKVGLKGGMGTFDRLSILANNEVTLEGNVIKFLGKRMGSYNGGSQSDLTITFDGVTVDSFGIAQVLGRIAYRNTSESLAEYGSSQTQRTIEIKLLDGEGGIGMKTVNLNLQGVNDVPIVGVNRQLSNLNTSYNSSAGWQTFSPNGLMPSSPPGQISGALDPQRQMAYGINTSKLAEGQITLDATTGFAVSFRASLQQESHIGAADINQDGKADQSGFNVLVISSDNTKAIKLGFFSDRIWAYNNDGTQAEFAQFDTHVMKNYQVVIKGNTYTLMADGVEILSDQLRNYSNLPSPFAGINNPYNNPGNPNPYTQSNYIFFGDDATTAGADVLLSNIQVLGSPSVFETTALPVGYLPPSLTIGEIRAIDVDGNSVTTFSLQDPASSPFDVSSSLSLKPGATLDYETQNSYTLILNGPFGQQPQLKVNVLDIMEVNKVGREDSPIAFTANDFTSLYNQPGSTPLTRIRIMTPPQNGTLKLGGMDIYGGNEIDVAQLNNLTFNPAANFNGTVTLNWDAFNGTTWINMNNPNPATMPVINLTIAPVNDAPILTLPPNPNQTVSVGAGAQTLSFYAMPADYNAPDEKNQIILAYEIVSNSNPGIFAVAPTIDANGKFTYTPMVSGAGGTATIGIRAKDSGGTANGGVDTSAIQTFTITVNPILIPNSTDLLLRDNTGTIGFSKLNGMTYSIWVSLFNAGANTDIIATRDFDQDGDLDMLVRDTNTGALGFWKMNGMAYGSYSHLFNVNATTQIEATGDFDKDGSLDFLVRDTSTGALGFWKMNGMAFAGYSWLFNVSAATKIEATGDFDKDGSLDILARDTNTGAMGFWKMNGMNFGSYTYLFNVNANTQISATGDFDKDGDLDILIRDTTTGTAGFWQMNGMAYAGYAALLNNTNGVNPIGVSDFDQDGDLDILVRDTKTSSLGFWKLNGMASDGYQFLQSAGSEWEVKGIGNFDLA